MQVNAILWYSVQTFIVFVNRRIMAGQKINSVLFICLGMLDAIFYAISSVYLCFCFIVFNQIMKVLFEVYPSVSFTVQINIT